MTKPSQTDELWEQVTQTISDEVKELLLNHRDKIMEYIRESGSRSTGLAFNTTVDMSKKTVSIRTRLTFTQIQKDSIEDELGDPEQPEFDETTKAAPKKRGQKKSVEADAGA